MIGLCGSDYVVSLLLGPVEPVVAAALLAKHVAVFVVLILGYCLSFFLPAGIVVVVAGGISADLS